MNSATTTLNALRTVFLRNCSNTVRIAFSDKYLLYTNVGISFTLSGVGDVLEQGYEVSQDRINKWDESRTKKMALSGITVGIVCHYYYKVLDKYFPGRAFRTLVKKIVVDQLICSPLCISTFLITVAYLEGSTMEKFVDDAKHKAIRLYKAEWIVWPVAQFVNFYFLPPRFRVLYDSTISLGYDVYTSYVNHDENNS